MKKLISILLASFALTVLAQGPTPVAPATPPVISAEKRANVEELVKLKKVELVYNDFLEQQRRKILGKTTQMLKGLTNPSLVAQAKKLEEELLALVTKECGWEAVKGDIVTVYATQLTDDEINGLKAFYATPAGQSYAEKETTLILKMAEVGQTRMIATAPKVQKALGEFAEKVRVASPGAPAQAAP